MSNFKLAAKKTAIFLLIASIIAVFVTILSGCPKGDEDETDNLTILEITQDDLIVGNEQAPITIVEYSDMQCPACAYFHNVFKQTSRLIRNDAKLVIRHFPLTQIHAHAFLAAQYIEAARVQRKHEDLIDKLFVNQEQWSEVTDAEKLFLQYASEIGLDIEKLKADKNDPAVKDKVQKDMASGNELAISGTPTIFMNGKEINFPDTPQKLFEIIQQEKQAISQSKLNK